MFEIGDPHNRRRLYAEPLESRWMLAGQDFFISPDGNDLNSGTSEMEAWGTFANIVSRYSESDRPINYHPLQGGDVVHVLGDIEGFAYDYRGDGNYQGLFLRNVHGEEGNPIVFRGIGMPDIGTRSPIGIEMAAVTILQSSYIVLEGFSITDTYGLGVHIAESVDVVVRQSYFDGIDGIAANNLAAIHVSGGFNISIWDNQIIDVYQRGLPGNQNNRPIVVFGSVNVEIARNFVSYSEIGLGFGIEYKHLGGLTSEAALSGTTLIQDNVIVNATEFGISSAAPNTIVEGNLLVDSGSIRIADIGGLAQLGASVRYNTVISESQNSRSSSLYFAPTEYEGYPLGLISFLDNLIIDEREYLTSETNTLEVNRYGTAEDYRKSVQAGLVQIDGNAYSVAADARFDLFGSDHHPLGQVYDFSGWQAAGFDRRGSLTDIAIDEFYGNAARPDKGWLAGDRERLILVPARESSSENTGGTLRLYRPGSRISQPLIATIQTSAGSQVSTPLEVTIPAGERYADFEISGTQSGPTEPLQHIQIRVATAGGLTASTWVDLENLPQGRTSGVFTIPGEPNSRVNLNAVVIEQLGEYRSETGIAYVDDAEGRINGIAPSNPAWLRELAVANRSTRLFDRDSQLGDSETLSLDSGRYAVFYLVQNSSLADWLQHNPSNQPNKTPVLFTSISGANPFQFDHLREELNGLNWTLAWEDLLNGGDFSFTDKVLQLNFEEPKEAALAEFDVQFSNQAGEPVGEVCVGQEFFVDIYARDLRDNPLGLFSATVDVEHSEQAQFAGPIEYGDEFPHRRIGVSGQQMIDELGAIAGLEGTSRDALVARIPMKAVATGEFLVTTDPADLLPEHETSLVGMDDSLNENQLRFRSAFIKINPPSRWHNSLLPEDTSGDGVVSPIDALRVVNFLNSFGSSLDLKQQNNDLLFNGSMLDVSGDNAISAIDVLLVINALNHSGDD